ncbi:MAG TPA: DUF1800 family protein, partial [Tepidisphaeraceae bacterium]|nr:DUF1800 family protein [Tepidisphaeraceae bacterium]
MLKRSSRVLALGVCVMVGVSSSARADDAPLTNHQKVVHALNRLAFGPRPGDVERVEKMGLNAWIDQQLRPEAIDDAKLDAKLQQFETLALPAHTLTSAYFNEIRRFIGMQQMTGNTDDIKLRTGIDVSRNKPQQEMPAGGMGGMILTEVARNVTLRGLGELQTAKVMRAAESERQLNEVLVDFWSNHFNVDVKKDPIRALKIVDDREVIRPHVLGKFRRLLGATAASPAMLVYLDNNENSAAHEVSAGEQKVRAAVIKGLIGIDDGSGMMKADKPMTEGGINENYARELLELHTLGVDGGYTQKDVEEVARCFTGWSYNPFTGTYSFEDKRHDNGEKHVLGQTIAAGGGVKDGMQVLDLLA